jgi:hypothetical protein
MPYHLATAQKRAFASTRTGKAALSRNEPALFYQSLAGCCNTFYRLMLSPGLGAFTLFFASVR